MKENVEEPQVNRGMQIQRRLPIMHLLTKMRQRNEPLDKKAATIILRYLMTLNGAEKRYNRLDSEKPRT